MGSVSRLCTEHKVEIRNLKAKAKRILELQEKYPGQLTMSRRMNLTVRLNDIMESVESLRRNKRGSSAYEFTYVFKKNRVKNRKLKQS